MIGLLVIMQKKRREARRLLEKIREQSARTIELITEQNRRREEEKRIDDEIRALIAQVD